MRKEKAIDKLIITDSEESRWDLQVQKQIESLFRSSRRKAICTTNVDF